MDEPSERNDTEALAGFHGRGLGRLGVDNDK